MDFDCYRTSSDTKIKHLRSDHGSEYLSKEFTAHLKSKGTERKVTMHDTPQHNGVAKRLNRTLMEHVRAVGHGNGLPQNLWGEALMHVVWVKNQSASRVLNGKTPYELLTGKKPNLRDVPEWGTRVWVHDANSSKLDRRARDGRWVGFDGESGAHWIFSSGQVTIKCNVTFDRREEDLVNIGGASNNTLQRKNGHTVQRDGADKPSATVQIEGENKGENPARRDQPDNSEQEVEDLLEVPTKCSNSPAPDKLESNDHTHSKNSSDGLDDLCEAFDNLEGPTVRRSSRQRTESPYMHTLRDGLGMTNGQSTGSVLPCGMQPVEARGGDEAEAAVSAVARDLDNKHVAYAMHAATCDTKVLEPRTIAEAHTQPKTQKPC